MVFMLCRFVSTLCIQKPPTGCLDTDVKQQPIRHAVAVHVDMCDPPDRSRELLSTVGVVRVKLFS